MNMVVRSDGWRVSCELLGESPVGYLCFGCTAPATVLMAFGVWTAEDGAAEEPLVSGVQGACHRHHELGGVRARVLRRLIAGPCSDEFAVALGASVTGQGRSQSGA